MLPNNFSMLLSEYLRRLSGSENEELCMKLILSPFGLCYGDSSCEGSFLVGHFLDELAAERPADKCIDVYDSVSCAWELGFEPAGGFLDHGHKILQRYLQNPVELSGF